MQAITQPKQKKAIQKRVARRERFARMARIRYRKKRNELIARVQDIDMTPKQKPQNIVYEMPLGMMIAETDEGICHELSLYNDCYTTNSVTVQNDEHKILSVKLHRTDRPYNTLNEQVLDEWEKRNDPYWNDWAKNFKTVKTNIKKFMEKNKGRLEANKLDEESLQKQKAYSAKRDELMSNKPCLEIRTRLNEKGSEASEILFNSAFVNRLNYDFEEFIQKILVEGIPLLNPILKKTSKTSPLYDDFENTFNEGYLSEAKDGIFFIKNSNRKKMTYSVSIAGYFVKNAIEISYMYQLNFSKPLEEEEFRNRYIYGLYMENQMSKEAERRYFLEMYYKPQLRELKIIRDKTCQIRELTNEIKEEVEETQEETDKNSIESIKTSEELVVKDNGESQAKVELQDQEEIQSNKINEKTIVSAPVTDYLTQLMPQLQVMKNIFEKRQHMLGKLLQENVRSYFGKQE